MSDQNQHHFDTACAALIRQGVPSGSPSGCLYRDGDRRCAVGWLIPDENYDPSIEGEPADQIDHLIPGPTDAVFLERLQKCHDNAPNYPSSFISEFKRRARQLAEIFDLNKEVLDAD
ncbi:hypothetical protein P1J78_20875 [Psychromarinibacter sp. C21-152]|uniref:Uncharacterized protein n=1 Tax=Psychromarinibacter sediminicola TaxID=3033385 RepID=A0AAE3NVT3_9RHOB|nr:hypothetical protein [Psychromarinibacter sediminicola]MDF0603201.1 hypothetical protein [Psychromarinibacter sediminicola]